MDSGYQILVGGGNTTFSLESHWGTRAPTKVSFFLFGLWLRIRFSLLVEKILYEVG